MNNDWKRNTVLFLTSQAISLFGSSLVQYAITWYITLETKSGVMMTAAIICGFLPTLFLSPFAGVWADRYNRKVLIILSDSLIAFSTLILAIFFFMGYDEIWLLFVLSAVRAIGSGIQTPAIGAYLPQLVPTDKLTKVNAVNGSIQSFIMLISPMLSGALLMMASIEMIFLVDVVTAIIAILTLVLFLHVPAHAKALEVQTTGYFTDMKDGFAYIRSHEYIKKFFIFCAFFFVLSVPAAFLTPLQVARSFGDEVWRLTAIEVAFSLGMIAGGGLMAYWGGFRNKVHTMALASFSIGICTVALGIIPNFWVYLGFMCIIGIVIPLFNTPAVVLLQERIEENFMGRVFGAFSMIVSAVMPLGMLIFGPLADIIKIEWLLLGTGVFLFIQGFSLLRSKVLMEAGRPMETEKSAEEDSEA